MLAHGQTFRSGTDADGHHGESVVSGERLGAVEETEEELAAITRLLWKRAESAPAGVGLGRAPAPASVNFQNCQNSR